MSLKNLMNFLRRPLLFRRQPSEVGKEERLKFIAIKTDDGKVKGNISFYCKALEVTRQAFYDYLDRKDRPWKYQPLVEEMLKIHSEDEYNDTYGRERMYMALTLKKEDGNTDIDIPCESTVRKVMAQIGLIHKPRRKAERDHQSRPRSPQI